jgi:hypothetical protein
MEIRNQKGKVDKRPAVYGFPRVWEKEIRGPGWWLFIIDLAI